MKSDFLPNTPFQIEQPENMYHFNSDTVLLGDFLQIKHKDDVLDVGCSTGALLLYAAMHQPKSLTGIDLHQTVIDQAYKNLELNQVIGTFYCCRMQEFKGQYDVLLCNPPYFETKNNQLKNDSMVIRNARHEDSLPLDELIENARRLLKDQGRFYLVHRASRLQDIMALVSLHHMKVSRLKIMYDHRGGISKSVVLEIRKGKCPPLMIEECGYFDEKGSF